MTLAIIGASGLVGIALSKLLEEVDFPVTRLLPVSRSIDKNRELFFKGKNIPIIAIEEALHAKPKLVFFATDEKLSKEWAPIFVAKGAIVIDNSTAWRLYPDCPLIVPEVNAAVLTSKDRLIANPSCLVVQLVTALAPLHQRYGIKRLVISTYQAVTGSGKMAVEQLLTERKGKLADSPAYAYPIDLNIIPQVGDFLDNGYTAEEMKLVYETRKILSAPFLNVTATTVRIPVLGGHSMSVNMALEREANLVDVIRILKETPGVILQEKQYPMPLYATGKDSVFVGRVRKDESSTHTFDLWIVADNLRKGAATNAIQIAQFLLRQGIIAIDN